MIRRRLALVYASLGVLAAIAGAVGAITLRIVDPAPMLPSTFGFGDTALVGIAVLGVSFAAVGALLVVRRSGNIIGWIMVAIGDGYAIGIFLSALTLSLAAHPSAIGWLDLGVSAWLTVLFIGIGGLVFALGFIFPTGRGQTPAWDRGLKVAAILTPFMFVTVFLLRPGPLYLFPTIDNPFGIGPDLRPWLGDQVSAQVSAMSVLLLPLVVWSIVARYRHAGHVERQQLKWVGLATAATIAALAIAGFSASLSDRPSEIGLALFGFAGALIPVAIGIAILRHGLYDIDRIISRTLAYATVTAVLAVVFTGVILLVGGVLTALAQGVIPSDQGRTIAVAISTLVVFALFQPVRRGVQRALDRRFDRARYDAGRTVEAFTDRLRYDVDLAAVSQEIVVTATAAVRPASATIWLRAGPDVRR
jgi:MFS family permease